MVGTRGAFLGLCEEGLVKGIPAGKYSASKDNKQYAVRAAIAKWMSDGVMEERSHRS